MKQITNRLINETSPYLLQHAYNPVDWFPWGEEALELAKKEDKPILISIGYSSCHWCHVMERESFEDTSTAELMNRHFINIKIDREERPDLDHIYMDAVQAIAGNGGWPLNVFLTPHLKPFYGGTYYPPVRSYNRASWKEVLHNVASAFKTKRNEIEEQADKLIEHLKISNGFGMDPHIKIYEPAEALFKMQMADSIYENIMKAADKEWGGFSHAPKFPQTFTIRYLLQYYHFTKSEDALKQACLSLDKMIYGGIFDHVGGGFARYSTDTEWLVPHFEKMLYDNALLVTVLSEAFQLTQNKMYEKAIHETLQFIEREMTSPEEGFYSALDADSEGVEGKYYIWTEKEVKEILNNDADLFCLFYDITEEGNWEGANIPRIKIPLEIFCKEQGLDNDLFASQLKIQLNQLHAQRKKRIRPLLDDKIILGWNALMNSAYSKAFQATGAESYRQKAVGNMNFLLTAFNDPENSGYKHVYKNKQAKVPAFLDDYAWFIQSLLDLQEITSDPVYLWEARKMAEHVISHFSEKESGFFFYTDLNASDVIFRKKEVYDGAVSSGNSVMCSNLYYLGVIFNNEDWLKQSVQMLNLLQNPIIRYPVSFGNWNRHLLNLVKGYKEVVVVGESFQNARDEVNKWYQPNKLFQAALSGNDQFPLLAGKTGSGETPNFFLCQNYSCRKPVENLKEFELILRGEAL